MWCHLIFMVLSCTFVLSVEHRDYTGCKVYEIYPKTEEQAYFLYNLSANDKYDFWSLPRGANVTARALVFPGDQQHFETNLKIEGIPFKVNDYAISETGPPKSDLSRKTKTYFIQPEFNRYLCYSEIVLYLNTLALLYPSRVTVKTEGESSEGRKIKSIRISNGDRIPNKKVIFITAGTQANEWIGSAVALYVIYQLVEKVKEHKYILRNYDWIILPVVNPDGYEYSHESNRAWKHTRSLSDTCPGADIDRNFDVHWGTVLTSSNPCSAAYGGSRPFSEPETRVVRDIMHSVKYTCKLYLSLHGNGRYLLYPWEGKGCKVYEIFPKTEEQSYFLYNLSANDKYDFWILPRGVNVTARALVFPGDQQYFETNLKIEGIPFKVNDYDISETEPPKNNLFRRTKTYFIQPEFNRYLRYSEIVLYLNTLALLYPSRVTVKTEGESSEGRKIKSIRISDGQTNRHKKVIFITAGIQGREWIGTAVALYTIHQLVEKVNVHGYIMRDFDWIILPVVNPDGYEYSHETDRLWSKTRRRFSESCFGANIDRNFDVYWGNASTSSDPCNTAYGGPEPFSEPETRVVRDILRSIFMPCKLYLSLHSNGRYLVYPWEWTRNSAPTWRNSYNIAYAGNRAIYKAFRRQYKIGNAGRQLYATSGGSIDYAYGKVNIPVSIKMKLPDSGTQHFEPALADILGVAQEAWVGIEAMAYAS